MNELKIEYLPTDELVPYENNPRMNDNGVEPVSRSIQEYGFKVPIVIDKNNVIVCGHTRLLAAKKLGLKKVPCIIADDLTEQQIDAFRIADNKVADFTIFDNKKLLEELEKLNDTDLFTGFDFKELEEMTVLNEKDNSAIMEDDESLTYECVCRSADREKVEKIKKIWEEMGGDD